MPKEWEPDITQTEEYIALLELDLSHEEILQILADTETGVGDDRLTQESEK